MSDNKNLKNDQKITWITVFIIAGFFAVGFFVVSGQRHLLSRDPASIPSSFEFSRNESSLVVGKAIIQGFKIKQSADFSEIALGAFSVRSGNGQKLFACQVYPYIKLTFEAEGQANSGEPIKMTVSGPCETRADGWSISALRLPVKKILGAPVGDSEFDFKSEEQVRVSFSNVGDAWPKKWVLQGVEFLDSESGAAQLSLNSRELFQLSPEPLRLSF